jgi:hypothetical protein
MRDVRDYLDGLPAWVVGGMFVIPSLLIAAGMVAWDCDRVSARLSENFPTVESVTWNPASLRCWRDMHDRGEFHFRARTATGETVRGYVCWGNILAETRIHVDQ